MLVVLFPRLVIISTGGPEELGESTTLIPGDECRPFDANGCTRFPVPQIRKAARLGSFSGVLTSNERVGDIT